MRNCDIKCKKRNTNYDCSGRGKSKPPNRSPSKMLSISQMKNHKRYLTFIVNLVVSRGDNPRPTKPTKHTHTHTHTASHSNFTSLEGRINP